MRSSVDTNSPQYLEGLAAGEKAGEQFGFEIGFIQGVAERQLKNFPRWSRAKAIDCLQKIDHHMETDRRNDPQYMKNHVLRRELTISLEAFTKHFSPENMEDPYV